MHRSNELDRAWQDTLHRSLAQEWSPAGSNPASKGRDLLHPRVCSSDLHHRPLDPQPTRLCSRLVQDRPRQEGSLAGAQGAESPGTAVRCDYRVGCMQLPGSHGTSSQPRRVKHQRGSADLQMAAAISTCPEASQI